MFLELRTSLLNENTSNIMTSFYAHSESMTVILDRKQEHKGGVRKKPSTDVKLVFALDSI
jgi:hypothetical protein